MELWTNFCPGIIKHCNHSTRPHSPKIFSHIPPSIKHNAPCTSPTTHSPKIIPQPPKMTHKRDNVSKICQLFNLACQHAERRANFLFWRTNVPKDVPIFQTFLSRNAKGNLCALLFYKNFYIILHIIVKHIVFICIWYVYACMYAYAFLYFL